MTAGWSNRDLIELITINEINLRCLKYLTHAKCNTLNSLLRGHRKRKEDLNQVMELVRNKQSYRTAPVEEVVRMLETDIKQYIDLCNTLRGRIHVPRTYNETIPPRELQALLEDTAAALSISGRTGPELWEKLLGEEGLVELVESAYTGEGVEDVNHHSVFEHVGSTFGNETPELEITIGGKTVKIDNASSVENAQAYLKHVSEWLGELCEKPTDFPVGYSSVCSDVYKTNQIVLAWDFVEALTNAGRAYQDRILSRRVFGNGYDETMKVIALMFQVKTLVAEITAAVAEDANAIAFKPRSAIFKLYNRANTYFNNGENVDTVLHGLRAYGEDVGPSVRDAGQAVGAASQYGFERAPNKVVRAAHAVGLKLLELADHSSAIILHTKLDLSDLKNIKDGLPTGVSRARVLHSIQALREFE
jgi:hypothetical protein